MLMDFHGFCKWQLPHYLSFCVLLLPREHLFLTSSLLPVFSSFSLASLPHSLYSPYLLAFFHGISLSSLTLSFQWVIDLFGSSLTLCWALSWTSLTPLVYLASPSSDSFGLIFVKEYGICVFTFFQSVSFSPTHHVVGQPGYTEPLPARWHS